jgi:hypothetical protein
VTQLPLPAGARFRCSNCDNRDPGLIKVWHTGGSSSARIVSFPKGKKWGHSSIPSKRGQG